MGTTLWGCRNRKTKARARTSSSESEEKEEDTNVGSLATCIINIVKQSCMWSTKKKRKIKKLNLHLHLQEKKHNQLLSKNNNNNAEHHELVTLQEWILASPSLNLSFINDTNNHNNVDEGDSNKVAICNKMYNNSSSNNSRVHPSFDRNLQGSCHVLQAKSRENLTGIETSEKLGEEAVPEVVVTSTSLCCSTTQSSKIKKKVSFRLPEVADIFMLDSQEGHFENV